MSFAVVFFLSAVTLYCSQETDEVFHRVQKKPGDVTIESQSWMKRIAIPRGGTVFEYRFRQ
jgi:hypothetical protein